MSILDSYAAEARQAEPKTALERITIWELALFLWKLTIAGLAVLIPLGVLAFIVYESVK